MKKILEYIEKKNTQIHKVFKFMSKFHILKSMYDSFTINAISYIIFN